LYAPIWCNAVNLSLKSARRDGEGENRDGKKMKAQSTVQIRTTISFPSDLYETLEEIAGKKKVSLAWVVRDTAERYVANQATKGRGGEKASLRATGKATRRAR
jgi:hypothetical protein